jgi:hypothetical protein
MAVKQDNLEQEIAVITQQQIYHRRTLTVTSGESFEFVNIWVGVFLQIKSVRKGRRIMCVSNT